MADRYWVGGSASWNGTAGTKWAATSGGAGGESVPTSADNVYFDANSGAVTVTVASGNTGCADLDFTGFTGTLAGSAALTISGSLVLGAGMTRTYTGGITFDSTGAETITSNGIALDSPITFNGAGGSWALQDDLTTGTARTTTLTAGTLELGVFNLSTGVFSSSNANTRAIVGSGTIYLTWGGGTVTVWTTANQNGMTATGFTGAINISGAGFLPRTLQMHTFPQVDWPALIISGGTGAIIPSRVYCKSWTQTSGFTGNLNAGTGAITLWGGGFALDAANGTPVADSDAITFVATSGSHTINLAGKTLDRPLTINAPGATYTLADDLTLGATRALTLTAGTLVCGAHNITASALSSSNSNTRALDLGSGTHTFSATGTPWNLTTSTGMTLTPGTSTIVLSAATCTFAGGGLTYHDLEFATAGGTATVTGSNTFNRIATPTPGTAMTLRFTAGTTTTVTEFDVNGTSGAPVTLTSSTAAQHTLVAAGGAITCSYLTISYSNASTGSWKAVSSTDGGNNAGWFPVFPSFSGTRTFVAVGGLATALGAASSGDVLVLAEGTHDVSTNVPAGVTIRGVCGDNTTLNVTSTIELGNAVTIRDLTVTATGVAFDLSAGSTWFEGIVFGGCSVSVLGPPSGSTATFHRCTFEGTSEDHWYSHEGADPGATTFKACLFLGTVAGDGQCLHWNDFTGDMTGLVVLFENCTIINTVARDILSLDTYGGAVTYTNNVVQSVNDSFFGDASDCDTGSGNYSNRYGQGEAYVTTVPDLHLHAYAPTNKSPFRNAVQASGFDRNHLPLSTSAGCYQWREQGSAIYKPRFLNPVNGIVFSYDGNTFTGSTEALSRVVRQVYDHLEVACRVRQYVQDLTHPSLGRFWVTADGYYRLTVDVGTFDLVISSPASRIFGTANLNDVDDTD